MFSYSFTRSSKGFAVVLLSGLLVLLFTGQVFCAAPETPVEITGVRITWVGTESTVSPKEKGERSFWKGGRPPTSEDYGSRDKKAEGKAGGNWGKFDVEFTTYREWEDEIEFRFYVLLKSNDGFKMFKGTSTVLWVARGKKHYAVMYVYPNAIARYGGNVVAIAVEAILNGKAVANGMEPKSKEVWWREHSPISGAIIDWIYTPMLRSGVQDYELVKIGK